MMRPLPVASAGASAPWTLLRLLLSLLMLAMFALGGQAMAQKAPSEATPMLAPPPPGDDDVLYNNASMVTQSVPSTMVVGGLYDVSILMRNTGTTAWYGASGYVLASVSPLMNTTWGLNRAQLPTYQSGPGNTATFNFQVRAPSAPGTYTFQWQMLQEGLEWFGVATYPITVTVREPVNNAQPTGQTVPTQMEAGRAYTVSVSVVNNGETTWTRAQNYTLMAQSPHNTMTWGLNRVALPVDNIAPGQSTTFTFQVTAPANAGAYTFQWGMQRETYGSFGPGTTPVTINVVAPPPLVNNAQVVGMTAPSRMIAGQRYDVAVTMRNNGTTTWAPGSNQLLGSQNPQDNAVWGMGRVQLPVAVAPGQQYTFTFQVTAPALGNYNMQWRMLQEAVEWFGATAGSAVTVTENLGNVTFIHTDGLGSPVARTDATGNVISRTRYEPYGYTASGATPSIGFTGHVHDADTGLTYMQQRYYDPVAGRFLSIDPVVTDANTGESFNRYAYANNSPYKFVDPDGRDVVFSVDPKAAGGNGHTTLYFQDKGGAWHAYNQGAAGDAKSSGNLGFLSGQNAKAGVSIDAVSKDSVPKDGLRISTNAKQDGLIATSAEQSAATHNSGKVEYNLYSNNCTDAAVGVVNSSGAGITVSNPATTVKPNSWIKEVKEDPKTVVRKEESK